MASDDEAVVVSDGSESDEGDEEVMEMPAITTEEQGEIERLINTLSDEAAAAPLVAADSRDGVETGSDIKVSKAAEKQGAKMAAQGQRRSWSIGMRLKILREVRNAGKDGKNSVLRKYDLDKKVFTPWVAEEDEYRRFILQDHRNAVRPDGRNYDCAAQI